MTFLPPVRAAARRLGPCTTAMMAVLTLAGCEAEYPADLHYPARTEPIVTEQIGTTPEHIDPPGRLDQILGALEAQERQGLPEDERKNYKGVKGVLNPAQVPADMRQKIDRKLEELFGTPRNPTVKGVSTLDEIKGPLKLDDQTLARGSEAYRLNCLHCHGLTGNGRGPTAPWVNPHPRDYRQGLFKFTSIKLGKERKARRDDLLRTLTDGIEGTSMPSFGLLPGDQLDALVSYVIHLSMRGELELNLLKEQIKPVGEDTDFDSRVNDILDSIATNWKDSNDNANLIRPETPRPDYPVDSPQYAASVKHGQELFAVANEGVCIKCHLDYGRQANFFYDDWGTIGRPADVTQGIYRGGRRPIDLYWRIYQGINGSNMPASSTWLKPGEAWDLVNFLQVLPYPKMREKYGIVIH